ncbi:SDR family NAD(P)-dependent oxidoreductase [Vibrio mimicus]|uniref:SDR family NAD(P)-dependent oxidoreductase n=1 Tax=Vibrio mimicus TaxID=674 RepID=UPI0013029304|nr:SDR family NAD(P)-dependent oxidoreductase [Vibrio mimicus]
MKSVLITGANRGLGLALAHEFDKHDYRLYLVVRTNNAKSELARDFPQAKILVSDVTCDSYESKLSEWLELVTLDLVINNAGSGTKAPTLKSTRPEYLRKEFETNCIAVLSTVKGSLDSLQRSAEPLIINISSRRGSLKMQSELAAKGSGCSYSYRISKAAQNMLTLCLADDLEDLGIKVVAIHPGRLLTAMGSSDADMSPKKSASQILDLVENKRLNNRDYISVETGVLPW